MKDKIREILEDVRHCNPNGSQEFVMKVNNNIINEATEQIEKLFEEENKRLTEMLHFSVKYRSDLEEIIFQSDDEALKMVLAEKDARIKELEEEVKSISYCHLDCKQMKKVERENETLKAKCEELEEEVSRKYVYDDSGISYIGKIEELEEEKKEICEYGENIRLRSQVKSSIIEELKSENETLKAKVEELEKSNRLLTEINDREPDYWEKHLKADFDIREKLSNAKAELKELKDNASVENMFPIIKSEVSNIICKIVNVFGCKILDQVLNLHSNSGADKISKAISDMIKEMK